MPAFMILGRIAGRTDDEIHQAWTTGQREQLIELRPDVRSAPRREDSMTCRVIAVSLAALVLWTSSNLRAQAAREFKDVIYASVDGKDLGLDVYLPAGVRSPPLLVWVHGGAWSSGTKAQAPMVFVANGFALASLDFRQSTEARFPAQVHDIKAAIRFLRAKAATYGYRTDRIAIAGSSSGGHLAALVGVTNGHPELEGTVGGHSKESSAVQAILDYYGASNLTTILAQSTPFGLNMRRPALERLLGAPPDQAKALATLASPVVHVDRNDPPLHLASRRPGSADADQPVARARRRLQEAGTRRVLRRRARRGARRRSVPAGRIPRARPRVPAADALASASEPARTARLR